METSNLDFAIATTKQFITVVLSKGQTLLEFLTSFEGLTAIVLTAAAGVTIKLYLESDYRHNPPLLPISLILGWFIGMYRLILFTTSTETPVTESLLFLPLDIIVFSITGLLMGIAIYAALLLIATGPAGWITLAIAVYIGQHPPL